MFPEILDANEVLLTNDSLLGPFDDISELISKLRKSKFDVTGITDNSQLQYHIQSYMVHLKRAALQNSNTINLLKSVVHLGLKNDVILKYELGLTRIAQLSGLFVGAIFPWNLITTPEKNPSLAGWQRLIELGFPFLKREAVRLGSHSDVTQMKKFIKTNYGEHQFIIQEIESIS
jgi:lipopolysaccharide biosynthesis protein